MALNIGNVRGHDNSQTDTFVFDHVKFGGHEDINIGNVLGDDNSQTDTFIFEHVNFGGKGGGSGDLNIEFGGHDINIGNVLGDHNSQTDTFTVHFFAGGQYTVS